MLNRTIYIDLEGADLTGKSTLLKTTFKESAYSKIMCFHDRGVLTHYLYNAHFKRFIEDQPMWLLEVINFVKLNGIIILVAGEDEIQNRFLKRSDDLFKLENIIKMNNVYLEFYNNVLYLYDSVRLINVDNKTPIEIYKEAERFYKQMLRQGCA